MLGLVLPAIATLALAACGGDDDNSGSKSTSISEPTGRTLFGDVTISNEEEFAALVERGGESFAITGDVIVDGSSFETLDGIPGLTEITGSHDGMIREFTPLGYALARLDFYSRQQPAATDDG